MAPRRQPEQIPDVVVNREEGDSGEGRGRPKAATKVCEDVWSPNKTTGGPGLEVGYNWQDYRGSQLIVSTKSSHRRTQDQVVPGEEYQTTRARQGSGDRSAKALKKLQRGTIVSGDKGDCLLKLE